MLPTTQLLFKAALILVLAALTLGDEFSIAALVSGALAVAWEIYARVETSR